jgi:hypothetical protein
MKIEFENVAEALIFCARQAAVYELTNKNLATDDAALLSDMLRVVENLAHNAPEKLEPRLLDGSIENSLYFINNVVEHRVYGSQLLRAAYKNTNTPRMA